MSDLKRLFNQIRKIAIQQPHRECSLEEIRFVMQRQSVSYLPEVYRYFLTKLGKGGFSRSHFSFPYVAEFKQDAINMIDLLHSDYIIPDGTFFFLNSGDITFYYFQTRDVNDNPPVYHLDEYLQPSIFSNSLSEFFLYHLSLV